MGTFSHFALDVGISRNYFLKAQCHVPLSNSLDWLDGFSGYVWERLLPNTGKMLPVNVDVPELDEPIILNKGTEGHWLRVPA